MLDISLISVKSIVKSTLHLADVPYNESFFNLAVTEAEMNKLRYAIYEAFGKEVRVLNSDTVYSLTDRLQDR